VTLPAPNLDDRRFQDLVDDAKRLVQQRCPAWTDHNVSDPGVTLIETVASMVDQLLYRLNRVPERHYLRFLDLIGVRLLPPTSAEAEVTFWLSAPQPATVTVPTGTLVATPRTEREEAVTFTVVADAPIPPCALARVSTATDGASGPDRTADLEARRPFECFEAEPRPGNVLLVGLDRAVPRCAVVLRLGCSIEGHGVDPRRPPVVWEAWDGDAWQACELEHDGTGGFNQPGDVILHVPGSHAEALMAGERGGWLRCRVVEAEPGQPPYRTSPRIERLEAHTIGATTDARHAVLTTEEVLGTSTGLAGQRFALRRRPVARGGDPLVLQVAGEGGWQDWSRVDDFGASGPGDRHFVLDEVAGEVVLGPMTREPDGRVRHHGAVPPPGAVLRLDRYLSGGGRRGNVARGTLTQLKSSIPYVARVENRRAAVRGVDAEDVEGAKVRGPLALRAGNRAVTAEDYEHLAVAAAPDIARVRCLPAGDGTDPGAVRIAVVPTVTVRPRDLNFDELVPPPSLLQAVAEHLDERRVIGARLIVEPPYFQGVTVVARLRARGRVSRVQLSEDALDALYAHLHPVVGGPDGTGWPFGRAVHAGDVYAVLQRVPGLDLVEDVRLFPADPVSGRRGEASSRIDLPPHALPFSYRHQVRAEEPG